MLLDVLQQMLGEYIVYELSEVWTYHLHILAIILFVVSHIKIRLP